MRIDNKILIGVLIFVMFIAVSLPVFMYLTSPSLSSEHRIGGGATASVSVFIPPVCGDTLCELNETCASCPGDCGICVCGDGTCDANESCITCVADCGACPSVGGDTGGRDVSTPRFEFEPWYFEEDFVPGESVLRSAKIINLGGYTEIEFLLKDLEDFVTLSKNSFFLAQNTFEGFDFEIEILSNAEPDVYIGQIEATSKGVKEIFPITLNIRELVPLLRVDVTLPEEREIFYLGENITANISIVNLGEEYFIDGSFYISNLDGEIIQTSEDRIFLQRGANTIPKSFILPGDIDLGYYLFFAKFNHQGKDYLDARIFRIGSHVEVVELPYKKYLDYSLIVLFFALVVLIFYFARRYYKEHKKKRKKRK